MNEDWRREFTFACGALGPYKHLSRIVNTVSVTEKVNALMSSVDVSTRLGYERAWRHWLLFCRGRGTEPWIDTSKTEWGEVILDFIIREYSILKLLPPSIRSKLPDIRGMRVVSEKPDFSIRGMRYKQLFKALARRRPTQTKMPVSPEMLRWVHDTLRTDTPILFETWLTWLALLYGFLFLLRGSEIMTLRRNDCYVSQDEEGAFFPFLFG